MGFEKTVLLAVEQAVPGTDAHFYEGTLFVSCYSFSTGRQIEDALRRVVTCDVRVAKFPNAERDKINFTFDFIPFADTGEESW